MNEDSRRNLDMGVDIGCPDLIISARTGGTYHVLYLEVKTKSGRLMESQKAWNADFDERFACGNCRRDVAYGYTQGVAAINAWVESLAF